MARPLASGWWPAREAEEHGLDGVEVEAEGGAVAVFLGGALVDEVADGRGEGDGDGGLAGEEALDASAADGGAGDLGVLEDEAVGAAALAPVGDLAVARALAVGPGDGDPGLDAGGEDRGDEGLALLGRRRGVLAVLEVALGREAEVDGGALPDLADAMKGLRCSGVVAASSRYWR